MAPKQDIVDPMTIDKVVVKGEAVSKRRLVGRSRFEKLPDNVKLLIYRYINLIRDCPVDILHERRRIKDEWGDCMRGLQRREEGKWVTPFYIITCTHAKIPVNLFRVSKTVYRHAYTKFIENNSFKLWLRSREDLEIFTTTLGSFLGMVRSVHVHLLTHDNRILKAHLRAQSGSATRLWERFCRLAAHKMPALKSFSFDCRITEPEMATILLKKLENLDLSHCAVHLSPQYRPELAKAARKCVMQAVQPPSKGASGSFPFLSLPRELQLMILKPLLTWHSDPMAPLSEFSRNQLLFNERKPGRLYGYQCCGTCSPNHYLCYCSARQSVYSSTCTCFVSPVAYFLVNKEMCNLCRQIFYGSNQFAYVGEDATACLQYLKALSGPASASIRHFTFVVPDLVKYSTMRDRHVTDIPFTSEYAGDWKTLISWMRKNTDLKRLNFNFVDMGHWRTVGNSIRMVQWETSLLRLFFEFQKLRGIGRFQIYTKDFRHREIIVEENVNGPSYKAPKWKYLPFIGWKKNEVTGEEEDEDSP